MASSREIKSRIRSVKNIGQITRALEAVSASRVRKAQARVLASRDYAYKAMEILLNVQAATSEGSMLHPLLQQREKKDNIMVVLITSDRGLAGAFNTNIIRVARRFANKMDLPTQWVTIGSKGRDALYRAGENVVADFGDLGDEVSINDLQPVSRIAKDAFISGEVDGVYIAYTDFINTLTQYPRVLPWLPMTTHDLEGYEEVKSMGVVSDSGGQDYEFEPSPQAIIDEIVPRFTDLVLYQTFLESKASEHSARMVAMRSASDNAAQLVEDLTLEYNKARQAAITSEILDIVGGAEALQAELDERAAEIEAEAGGKDEAIEDLTKIDGITPEFAEGLKRMGITSRQQLANMSDDEVMEVLQHADPAASGEVQ